MIKHQG